MISFMASANFHCVCSTIGTKTKSIISVRVDPKIEYAGRKKRILAKSLFCFADGAVFQTDEARQWFSKKLQARSEVIFNPIDHSFFDVDRNSITGKVITCGRLTNQKNHTLLINAVMSAKKTIPSLELYIYGEGPLKDTLIDYKNKFEFGKSVYLPGRIENVLSELRSADLFILSSNFEGMPNALMEALAAGVPSISTDCPSGGPRELIQNGINGLLVPVGDEELMRESIIAMYNTYDRKIISKMQEKWQGNMKQVLFVNNGLIIVR